MFKMLLGLVILSLATISNGADICFLAADVDHVDKSSDVVDTAVGYVTRDNVDQWVELSVMVNGVPMLLDMQAVDDVFFFENVMTVHGKRHVLVVDVVDPVHGVVASDSLTVKGHGQTSK